MSIEEKLEMIRANKLTIEYINSLEKEYEQISSYKRVSPTGEPLLDPTDELLSLLIKIQLTYLKSQLVESAKHEIEFEEQVVALKKQAEGVMKSMSKHFGDESTDDR